ncbi:glycosyltransferase [Mitsuokella multacida]|uniref:glycosyltransferase n=1 Tax=Mitsuokella multacida TaxID=52226 RepID=UPI0022E86770|nr:glycosyltransferase [Mitsuokella multacida]
MYKVLQVGMTENKGGTETYLMSQYRKLNRNEIRYDFLSFTSQKMAYEDEIVNKGDKVYHIISRLKNPLIHYYRLAILMWKMRKSYSAVVVNTCDMIYVFPLFIGWLFRIKKRIIHSHNSGYERRLTFFHKMVLFINKIIVSFSVTDRWACSELAGKWMFGNKDFVVIHNAINLELFKFNSDTRKRLRHSMKSDNAFVLGNVARFSYQKNHEFLIKIFKEVHDQDPSAQLWLIGNTSIDMRGNTQYYDNVCQLIEKYHLDDSVKILGVRNDVPELYQAMDCYVLPSRFEGLCVSAIEAQAADLPCVVSDRLSDETKLIDDFLYLPLNQDTRLWARKILEFRNRKRCNNDKIIRAKGYDINAEVKRVTQLYFK